MAKYTENDLLNALADIQRGMAAAKAAKLWSVPRTTLRDRLRGAEPLKVAMAHCQRLSPSQEESLAQWIRIQGTFYALQRQGLKPLLVTILKLAGARAAYGPLIPKNLFAAVNYCPNIRPNKHSNKEISKKISPSILLKRGTILKCLMRRLHRKSAKSIFFALPQGKLTKAHDQLIFKKSLWDKESKSLKAQLQLLQPQKRAIVKPNPNEKVC